MELLAITPSYFENNLVNKAYQKIANTFMCTRNWDFVCNKLLFMENVLLVWWQQCYIGNKWAWIGELDK